MVARPFSFMKTACTQSFLTPRSQSDLLNGSQFNGALWVPPASQEPSYQVLPVTWMARRPAFWLHIEGDSELARAEKEELISLFNGGDVGRVLGHPVICIGLLRETENTFTVPYVKLTSQYTYMSGARSHARTSSSTLPPIDPSVRPPPPRPCVEKLPAEPPTERRV